MVELLEIAPLDQLFSHFRYQLTLRSTEGNYRSLILFRLSTSQDVPNYDQERGEEETQLEKESDPSARLNTNGRQLYAMEATCPHLGAELSHAEIEDCGDSVVAVCPWHRYDFDLRTGKSETGLKACTFAVYVNVDDRGVEMVSLETPNEGSGWRLVELRPVSEGISCVMLLEFADPPRLSSPSIKKDTQIECTPLVEDEPVVPLENPPKTLMQWGVLILNTPNPTLKVERTRHAVHLFRTGKLKSIGHKSANAPRPPEVPSRDASWMRNLETDPTKVKHRKNKAVMLHALANIEQWAIDLAWDIMVRFGPLHPDIPPAFFHDFTKMALDEAKHFSFLTTRLSAISPSTPYGSMPVQASLWESATTTSHSLRARLAIIHLVHEARGLDVNPGTIDRFRRAGDIDTVKAMEVIHSDEVTHVTSGHRWFMWICEQQGINPEDGGVIRAFREEVKKNFRGEVKGPFNVEARETAGMTRDFYENLRGENRWIETKFKNKWRSHLFLNLQ
ncbi:hypothetical protein AGABI2DRAFT_188477 [Agaricus bisporus var. bisporus H97]|uniref:hypothetical protein n=1 Tax=Agaricus bisporus var. bisporus (strain H97 / ATCC MYA-4626 / FGSC 10389) TaxID=936046 RepID=UPI00029F6462|nr:hypothetical protein AGABI2DRAFT_188477 [Agaricus bisporus var. bisporus H97]EKV42895.1 hypothetical protein AGABI2DRAFT_188477 [Agaricus bisporus var. bisporus H97]